MTTTAPTPTPTPTRTTLPPEIRANSPLVTQLTEIAVRPADQSALVDALERHADERLADRPGLVSYSLHRSTDGERIVTYGQWRSAADLAAAERDAAFPRRDLALWASPLLFDVAYTNDVTSVGVTRIEEGLRGSTFINVITPQLPVRIGGPVGRFLQARAQRLVVDFVVRNDKRYFAPHPGYQSANFHRSQDGTRVVNYSHWDDEQAFLEAIGEILGCAGLTMAQANALARKQARRIGSVDFHFHDVVRVLTGPAARGA